MKPVYIQLVVATAVVLIAFSPAARAADVAYISGGTGVDERQELLAKEKDYSLKIVAGISLIVHFMRGRP